MLSRQLFIVHLHDIYMTRERTSPGGPLGPWPGRRSHDPRAALLHRTAVGCGHVSRSACESARPYILMVTTRNIDESMCQIRNGTIGQVLSSMLVTTPLMHSCGSVVLQLGGLQSLMKNIGSREASCADLNEASSWCASCNVPLSLPSKYYAEAVEIDSLVSSC